MSAHLDKDVIPTLTQYKEDIGHEFQRIIQLTKFYEIVSKEVRTFRDQEASVLNQNFLLMELKQNYEKRY